MLGWTLADALVLLLLWKEWVQMKITAVELGCQMSALCV